MLWECYKNIVEICYVHNIFTINHRWLVVISSNLNLPLKLLFYPTNNNLMHKIYCENVVNMTFLLIITNKKKKKKKILFTSLISHLFIISDGEENTEATVPQLLHSILDEDSITPRYPLQIDPNYAFHFGFRLLFCASNSPHYINVESSEKEMDFHSYILWFLRHLVSQLLLKITD